MKALPEIIKGGSHSDERGTICYVNDFDMSAVKRFYRIIHPNTLIERGWRAHRIEQRWFNVIKGSFRLSYVKIDDWHKPNPSIKVSYFNLNAQENLILHVPNGYATSLKALTSDSEILVFADFGIEHANNDDYLFAEEYFSIK